LDGFWENAVNRTGHDLDWDKCEILDQFIKEGQRMRGVSTTLFYRTCMKNHKIGKIKIK